MEKTQYNELAFEEIKNIQNSLQQKIIDSFDIKIRQKTAVTLLFGIMLEVEVNVENPIRQTLAKDIRTKTTLIQKLIKWFKKLK